MFKHFFGKINIYKYYRKAFGNKKSRWVVILLTILYFIIPIDLIPEIFLGPIGLIDDGVLFVIFCKEIINIFRNNKTDNESKNND